MIDAGVPLTEPRDADPGALGETFAQAEVTRTRTEPSRRAVVGGAATGALALASGIGAGPAAAAVASGGRKIMIIRHAEKPEDDGTPPPGIGADGNPDRHALLVRGWERAGALGRFFAPRDGRLVDPALATPKAIIAAAPSDAHRSERSVLTVGPLAALLGLTIDTRFDSDDTAGAARAAVTEDGPVLIAWEHKRIADLVSRITGGAVARLHWPGKRFDMVLVLDRDGAEYRLLQVPQMLLAGDSEQPFEAATPGDPPD